VVDAIERALGGEAKSSDLRRMITAARGAINGLMAEFLEEHSGGLQSHRQKVCFLRQC